MCHTTNRQCKELGKQECMHAISHLRNEDNDLIRVYWRAYDNYDVPPPSNPVTGAISIIRARQKLQAAGYFLPTDPAVIKHRRKQEVKMREYALEKT